MSASSEIATGARVVIGTEAVLHRAGRAGVVVFVDFDQELLAPRFRAGEQAMALLARAARIVGGRSRGGRIVVQTRVPDHDVNRALVHGDPMSVVEAERGRRQALGMPPFRAIAAVSGAAAPLFVAALQGPEGSAGIEVIGPDDGMWLVRAPGHAELCDALAAVARPPGRLRIEVDPLRI
ncbi:MAG: hypothetical protein ACLGIC_13205 [Acidimicrobiia bacterium]